MAETKKVKRGKGPKKGAPNAGRPIDLTPELQAEIVTYIEAGSYVETAAQAVGIHKATFYAWLKKSNKETKGIYRDFNDAIQKAMARAELRDVKNIYDAAQTQWQASAWRLERKYPDRWGRKDRSETVVTMKPYVVEDINGKEALRLGSEKIEMGEISIDSIEQSEQNYYDAETIDEDDNEPTETE